MTSDLVQLKGTSLLPSAVDLMFDPALYNRLSELSEIMARGAVTVPEHLRGKPADCFAVCLQATQWRMNPFAVSQKTFITPNGKLGYESQLINAVISQYLEERPSYEWFGDWDRIIGRFERKTSQRGKEYFARGWTNKEEEGLGIRVVAKVRGAQQYESLEVLLAQAAPRFSTLWAVDPRQQLAYLAIKRWASLYLPDAVLGVYSRDDIEANVIDVTPEPAVMDSPEPASRTEALKQRLKPKWSNDETLPPSEPVIPTETQRESEPTSGTESKLPSDDEPVENTEADTVSKPSHSKEATDASEDYPKRVQRPDGSVYWVNVHGEVYDPAKHGWSTKRGQPATNSDGTYRALRGTGGKPVSSTETSESSKPSHTKETSRKSEPDRINEAHGVSGGKPLPTNEAMHESEDDDPPYSSETWNKELEELWRINAGRNMMLEHIRYAKRVVQDDTEMGRCLARWGKAWRELFGEAPPKV